ncbi:hypothetical protein J2752_000617 [Halarchaeum rubridurum]|uniref:Uncharacterized protein n=1 Tax=Halarchaeum rubridurum TaxID=489911 RepID=A0A830FN93_9EURY|nr:DUF5804 family protein [Halarchaeum rubridurum]MBP1953736.1 hypothetical protein [Halarchaeum rubridurum]GGM54281.1 hypothetical protein GCM10009017_00770 [Halarchaeum rubridurum]
MTEVCIVAEDDAALPDDLYAYETAYRALATYDPTYPWTNALVVETMSLGTAVSLLNDLDWYLSRVSRDAFVRDPSVSEREWLSRPLARELRDGDADPEEAVNRLRVYGVDDGRLVDPTMVLRGDAQEGAYERSEYDDTVVVRVTREEFH